MWGTIRNYGPAVVSGIALSFCFPRFQWFFLAWIALVPLLWHARTLPPVQAALHFFIAGYVFHTLVLQWLLANIMWAGGWALLGQQLLCLFLALYWAVAGLLWRWLGDRNAVLGGPLTFALLWVGMDHAQATLFTGFGWTSLAYTQGRDPYVLQLAAVGTGLLIVLALALVNALLAESFATPARAPLYLVAALALVGGAHGAGFLLLKPSAPDPQPFKVGLFQSNYSLEMKWDPEYRYETVRNASQKSVLLAERTDLDLMVWPEALILADVDASEIRDLLQRTVRQGKFSLFAGAARTELTRNYNSALFMNESGEITGWYDKMHLAPYGEYVPLAKFLPFVSKIVPSLGDLDAGTEARVMKVNGRAIGPLICFEVLFPQMSNRLRREGADFLVVITNLAWWGRSTAIPQELEIARVRAVESRLPLVHAANTGIAGVFDPYGRFTPVDTWAANPEQLYPLQENIPMEELIMMRLVGAFSLPAAAPQPFLDVQRFLPYVFDALCAALLLVAVLIPGGAAGRSGAARRD